MADEFVSPESTPVNYIMLAGQRSPGYAEILNLSAPRRLRIMAGPGFDGAAINFIGFTEQKFSVKFHLYNDQDWQDWHVFKQLITKAASKNQRVGGAKVERALDIVHPYINDPLYNITTVVVEDVGPYTREGDTGEWTIEVKFVSALKRKENYAAIEGSKDAPLDARDRTIQDNTSRMKQRADTIEALQNQKARAPGK